MHFVLAFVFNLIRYNHLLTRFSVNLLLPISNPFTMANFYICTSHVTSTSRESDRDSSPNLRAFSSSLVSRIRIMYSVEPSLIVSVKKELIGKSWSTKLEPFLPDNLYLLPTCQPWHHWDHLQCQCSIQRVGCPGNSHP